MASVLSSIVEESNTNLELYGLIGVFKILFYLLKENNELEMADTTLAL